MNGHVGVRTNKVIFGMVAFCFFLGSHTVFAKIKPRASVQKISSTSRRHPITDNRQLALSIRVQKKGEYFGQLAAYIELESGGEKYFGKIKLNSTTSYGVEYVTSTELYLTAGKNPRLVAYWVGYYYRDGEMVYLLSSKDKGVPDLQRWLAKTENHKKAYVTNGGTSLMD